MDLNFEKELVRAPKEFYAISKKVSSLAECLNSISAETLDIIYEAMKRNNQIIDDDVKNRKDKIKLLETVIPNYFKLRLENTMYSDEFETLDEVLENGSTKGNNKTLLGLGIMYYLKKEKVSIIPKELLSIYKEYKKSNKKHELDLKKIEKIVIGYLTIDYMVPLGFIEDIILNKYHFDVKKKDIEDVFKKLDVVVYNDKYNVQKVNENETMINYLEEEKGNKEYIIYSEQDINDYYVLLFDLNNEIGVCLNNDINLVTQVINFVTLYYKDGLDDVKKHLRKNKIPKENINKVVNLLNTKLDDIRFWTNNGITIHEFMKDNIIKNNFLQDKPKSLDIKSIFEKIEKDNFNILLKSMKARKSNFEKTFISNFKASLEQKEKFILQILSNANDMLVDDLDLIDANLCIYMFYYKSKDGIRAIVPSEFQKIIEDNLEKRNFIEKCRKM